MTAGHEVPVSAIVPCFRCATTIHRSVSSVASQTVRPMELILVDDASGDRTLERIEELRAEWGADWLRPVALKANRGPAAARNAGWEVARGEYVAFLDADDTWQPSKIECQYAFMQSHPEFAVSGHRALYGDSARAHGHSSDGTARHREISRIWVLLKNPMVTPSMMVRRDFRLRFHEGSRHMEDQRFLQEAVFSGARVARIERELAVVHKAAYGAAGLSAELWAMERGELSNYSALRDAGHIGALARGLLSAYSLAKFCRRVAVTRLARTRAL